MIVIVVVMIHVLHHNNHDQHDAFECDFVLDTYLLRFVPLGTATLGSQERFCMVRKSLKNIKWPLVVKLRKIVIPIMQVASVAVA